MFFLHRTEQLVITEERGESISCWYFSTAILYSISYGFSWKESETFFRNYKCNCNHSFFYSSFQRNVRVEIPTFLRSVTNRTRVLKAHARFSTLSAWAQRHEITRGIMADKVKASWFKVSTNKMCKTLKQRTKYAHTVRGRPTLKYAERFRNGSVREHYEGSFMGEPIENLNQNYLMLI